MQLLLFLGRCNMYNGIFLQIAGWNLYVGQGLEQRVDCALQWCTLRLAEPLCAGTNQPRCCRRHKRVAAEMLPAARVGGLLSCQLCKQLVQAMVGCRPVSAEMLLIWLQRFLLQCACDRILSWHPACSWVPW